MKGLPEKNQILVFISVLMILNLVVSSSGCVAQEDFENPYDDENITISRNSTQEDKDNIAEILKREIRKRIENVTIGDILDSFSQK